MPRLSLTASDFDLKSRDVAVGYVAVRTRNDGLNPLG
jgi:hypothetical protein